MAHADQRIRADIVKQRFQMIMEQWEPALHALTADGGPRRFIGRITRGRAEFRKVFFPETGQHIIVEQDFADRGKGHALGVPC